MFGWEGAPPPRLGWVKIGWKCWCIKTFAVMIIGKNKLPMFMWRITEKKILKAQFLRDTLGWIPLQNRCALWSVSLTVRHSSRSQQQQPLHIRFLVLRILKNQTATKKRRMPWTKLAKSGHYREWPTFPCQDVNIWSCMAGIWLRTKLRLPLAGQKCGIALWSQEAAWVSCVSFGRRLIPAYFSARPNIDDMFTLGASFGSLSTLFLSRNLMADANVKASAPNKGF